MRTVRDESGTRYLLVKRSEASSLVRDPATGEERYLPNGRLAPESEPPLVTVARTAVDVPDDVSEASTESDALPDAARQVLAATPSERALGLLVELDRDPRSVRSLLARFDLCESDLHGLLTAFRAAGLLTETDVHGARGYRTTETAREGLAHLSYSSD